MKRAVLLHGTDGSPAGNWLPWLKEELEKCSYEVWAPQLPNSHTPNRQDYNDFLLSSDWNFKDNLIVGHSSGAVSILNLLEDKRCPEIETAILIGAWADSAKANLNIDGLSPNQFINLFPPNGFQFDLLKSKASHFLFLHGDNDPYCPVDQAEWLAEQTGGEIIVIPGGGHISQEAGFNELPELTNALESRHWL